MAARNNAAVTNYWLVKQEPSVYSWDDFVREGETSWTGVRNYTARNNLRSMKVDDEVLFYHSGTGKNIVGVARVSRAPYPDATAQNGDWSAVDLAPVKGLRTPVALAQIKAHPTLKTMSLARLGRLSVHAVTPAEFREIIHLGQT